MTETPSFGGDDRLLGGGEAGTLVDVAGGDRLEGRESGLRTRPRRLALVLALDPDDPVGLVLAAVEY